MQIFCFFLFGDLASFSVVCVFSAFLSWAKIYWCQHGNILRDFEVLKEILMFILVENCSRYLIGLCEWILKCWKGRDLVLIMHGLFGENGWLYGLRSHSRYAHYSLWFLCGNRMVEALVDGQIWDFFPLYRRCLVINLLRTILWIWFLQIRLI